MNDSIKKTPDTILVKPFNKEKLKKHFSKFITLEVNEDFIINQEAIFLGKSCNLLIDNECCAEYLENKINISTKKNELVATLGIRKSRKTDTGKSFDMFYSTYIDVYQSEFSNLTDDELSLKEFMGRRYDYNPRISKNTRGIVNLINEI